CDPASPRPRPSSARTGTSTGTPRSRPAASSSRRRSPSTSRSPRSSRAEARTGHEGAEPRGRVAPSSSGEKMPPMTIHPITICGEPVLHTRAKPVTEYDASLTTLIDDMYETQEAAHGVGLAAPQIGVGLRIFTWNMVNEDGVA